MTMLIIEDEMAPVPDWVWLMALAEKHNITAFPEDLEQFVRELIAAEREACAKVCDDQSKEFGGVAKGPFVTDFGKHTQMSMAAGAENCAAAIRARGQT